MGIEILLILIFLAVTQKWDHQNEQEDDYEEEL